MKAVLSIVSPRIQMYPILKKTLDESPRATWKQRPRKDKKDDITPGRSEIPKFA